MPKRIVVYLLVLVGMGVAVYLRELSAPVAAAQATGVQSGTVDPLLEVAVPTAEPVRRLMDAPGFVDPYNAERMENHLAGMYDETGVDIRFIFEREIADDLESFALRRARQLGLGRDTDRRGLLFVYDVRGQRMRIEVGPGLEGIFPDGFVGYLMREQTAAFFAAGDRMAGIKSTLFVVNHRLREAALGQNFNPRAIAYITDSVRLAAGAGVSARAPLGTDRTASTRFATTDVRARFGAQPTVAQTLARYHEALRDGYHQPDLPLYAPGTESILRRFPIAKPFAGFILVAEYGHKYTIVERGDLAILFFTTTPLVSAHLFRRSAAGWQLDLEAEVRNTRELISGGYTWMWLPSGDAYSLTFSDLFSRVSDKTYQGFKVLRPTHGDNRRLPTRLP